MSRVEIGFNAEARTALAKFVEAKRLEAEAKALKAEAEAQLRSLLGEATEATIGGVVAYKLVERANTYTDNEKLQELYPEAYEAVRYSTPYNFIKVIS